MNNDLKKTDGTVYDNEFYNLLKTGQSNTITRIVPIILSVLSPLKKITSVLDIGCALGAWLRGFKEYGVNEIMGVDGDYVNKKDLLIDLSEFKEADLEQPLDLNRKFDLVYSLEVAEHISKENAKQFVDSLCNHSDIVLFSAAIPFQGGTHHVNEQFPSYWASLFAQNDYVCCDCLRKMIWDNEETIASAYKQNIMFFIKRTLIESCENENIISKNDMIDIVSSRAYFTWTDAWLKVLLEREVYKEDLKENELLDITVFDRSKSDSYRTAIKLISTVLELLKPLRKINSVLDVGCGTGTWLRAFKSRGISEIVGVDGASNDKDKLYINKSEFIKIDLEQPFNLKRHFDLVISIEAAQYISEEHCKQFIESLCNHGDIVLFSAAIPFQGGNRYLNGQFPSYWAKLFAQNGYICCDCIREKIWDDSSIEYFYRQNILFFIKKELVDENSEFNFLSKCNRMDVVHPIAYLERVKNYFNLAKKYELKGEKSFIELINLLLDKKEQLIKMDIKESVVLKFKQKPVVVYLALDFDDGLLRHVLTLLRQNGIEPALFCADFKKEDFDTQAVKNFFTLEEAVCKLGRDINIIIVSDINSIQEMIFKLLNQSVDVNFVYTWDILCDIFDKNYFYNIHSKLISDETCITAEKIKRFSNEIQSVLNSLYDENSKHIYLSILTIRLYNEQFEDYPYLLLQQRGQYFCKPIVLTEEEIFIDAGACWGDTIFRFLDYSEGKYKEIHTFEPDIQNYNILIKKIEKLDNIVVYKKGLYDTNGFINFDANYKAASQISENGSIEIETVKGDDLNLKPTFIKMDIEGAELKALQGFSHTIRTYKPKLAISIYHKVEDLWEIPLFIKALVPEYKLYIRHHAMIYGDSILYAVCD